MQDYLFDISYVSRLPLLGDSPKVTVIGTPYLGRKDAFKVHFVDFDTKQTINIKECGLNETVIGERQWFTNWLIKIYDADNVLIHSEKIDLNGKTVFIKIDAYALGDNIAWMPYVEKFRTHHNCHVICSTFFNNLFEKEYPQILFAVPNTQINNIYAQYYIGANTEINQKYSPVVSTNIPLQFVASKSLGIEDVEIVPRISTGDLNLNYAEDNYGGKYVCISEHASFKTKEWKASGGWQAVVDFLNSSGYKVVVISKEPTELQNIINKTGNFSLSDRIEDLKYAEFFIGVSSGLSWISWAVGTYVVMISDVTPSFHEFQSNITRIGGETLDVIDYDTSTISSVKEVIEKIKKLV
jgi:autotransporter strand-loop-strand O-heptosyltransferase